MVRLLVISVRCGKADKFLDKCSLLEEAATIISAGRDLCQLGVRAYSTNRLTDLGTLLTLRV